MSAFDVFNAMLKAQIKIDLGFLEGHIELSMISAGLNPTKQEDIDEFWSTRLD